MAGCRKWEQAPSIRKLQANAKQMRVCLEDSLKLLPKKFRDERGQAMLEIALCLPVMLLLVTGIMMFGLSMNNYLMLTNATNTGAQQLAVSRGYTSDPCNTVVTGVYAATPNLVHANMVFTLTLNGTTYTGTSCSAGSTTTGSAANMVQGTEATVNVTYPCNLTVYGKNFAPGCKLQSQTSVVIQ
jgi:Flp pilus assembly protein TadG